MLYFRTGADPPQVSHEILYLKDMTNIGVQAYFEAGIATNLMLACVDRPKDIDLACLSLLAIRRSIIVDKTVPKMTPGETWYHGTMIARYHDNKKSLR